MNLVFSDADIVPLRIARVSEQNFVRHIYYFSSKQNTLTDIFLYDWEADGSVGNLSVPVEKIIDTASGSGKCNIIPDRTCVVCIPDHYR